MWRVTLKPRCRSSVLSVHVLCQVTLPNVISLLLVEKKGKGIVKQQTLHSMKFIAWGGYRLHVCLVFHELNLDCYRSDQQLLPASRAVYLIGNHILRKCQEAYTTPPRSQLRQLQVVPN